MAAAADNEIASYRSLIEPPSKFHDGFGWTTWIGILFCGLVMMPGGIYLGLITGTGIGSAASWVTLILFMEIARRAFRPLSKQNLVVLLHAATVMMAGNLLFPGGPFGQLVFRAYLVTSEAVRDAGMLGSFPRWFAPSPNSAAIVERSLTHEDWLIPSLVLLFMTVVAALQRYTLGYFFFRFTSDVERLPFPLASVNALGAIALADIEEAPKQGVPVKAPLEARETPAPAPAEASAEPERPSERRRVFALGAVLGLGYGFLMVGVPALTGLFLAQPFYLVPQPFVDLTTLGESFLPSTPLGVTLDLAVVFFGFVLPFWTVVGTFTAIVLTTLMNPVLHHFGVLHTWQPGMDTVNTAFSNNVDFWLSFSIGSGLGLSVVSLASTLRDVRRRLAERSRSRPSAPGAARSSSFWPETPEGRGDYSPWLALGIYLVSALGIVGLCLFLMPPSSGVTVFLLFFAFLYAPFIAYVNARLLGLSGQGFDIPYVREGAFLLSGARGIEIWLLPIPQENYGWQAQQFRTNELVGVRFWSLIKTELVVLPVMFVLSFLFWAFIWKADAVPSTMFPWAQVNWELHAKNSALLYSSTFVPPGASVAMNVESEFMKAMHPGVIAGGFLGAIGASFVTALVGLPALFYYGLFRGFGQLPHYMLLEIVGALVARRLLHKRFGKDRFLRLAPILLAGYLTGVGLIGMATIALRLIKSAVSAAPF